MAVLALGFAGQAIGAGIGGSILGVSAASIGGFVGSAIGSMIDNRLFPQKQTGPRLDDLSITASTYGKPLPLLFGRVRMAGNVIWSTGLIETVKKTKQGGKGGPTVQTTEFSYRASFAVAIGEGEIQGIRKIWANNKLIYDVDEPPDIETGLYSSIVTYPGSFTQDPDPTIEAYKGAGLAPAYLGTAYVVIGDLQLADFGNRLPNLEFLVDAHDSITVGAVVDEIVTRCGIDRNKASTGSLGGVVKGFAIGSASSGVGALQPLALAFDFDVAEVGGALRCTPRGSSPAGLILREQLAGHDAAEERPETITWERQQVTTLPREAAVTFADPDRDYQPNTQTARRAVGTADSNLQTDVAVVLDVDEGRALADRMLWEAWTGIQTARAATDDRWIAIEPGRVYVFETPAGFEPLRVTRATRGANGVIDFEIVRDRAEVYSAAMPGIPAAVPPNEIRLPGLTELIMLDIPLLLDADEEKASGFYWGLVGSGEGWRGADFLRAIAVMDPFSNIDSQGRELTVGDAGVLAAPTLPFDSAVDWDNVSTLQVDLRRSSMMLESMTEAEVLAGGNAAYVGPSSGSGGEIIQFRTASLIGPGVYEISNLRRGQRGTEFAWGGHGAGEMFVLLEPSALRRVDFGVGDLNLERLYKAVSLLTSEADTASIPFTNTGAGLRPYAPISLAAEGDTGPSDVDLSWIRRSRIGWPDVDPPPLAEESERYMVRIMNALGTVIVRQVETTSPSFVYTEAMQTTDFGAPVSNLRWRVAQISTVYGPGVFAEWSGPV